MVPIGVFSSLISSAGTKPRPLVMVREISSVTDGSSEQMCCSGFNTLKEDNPLEISSAVNSFLPLITMFATSESTVSTILLNLTCLRLRMMSCIPSITPGIVANSWSTPEILIWLIAKPSREARRMRRRALPMVCPYPGSRGLNSKRPTVSVPSSIITLSGF